MHNKQ